MRLRTGWLLLTGAMLGGCDLAPDYQPPTAPSVLAFKEDAGWKQAGPADSLPRGAWWRILKDERVNALETRLTENSPTLQQAVARYDQAVAAARIVGAQTLPALDYTANSHRQQTSRQVAVLTHPARYSDSSLEVGLSWEVDLWGRVKNSVAAAADRATASAGDLASLRLSLEASLASATLSLEGLDAQQDMLDRTVTADQEALDFTRRRHEGGVAAEVDVDQAESQLASSRTIASDNRRQRAQLEHAIALLVGEAPANFTLPPQPLTANPPVLAVGLPSALLERRPDIAAAERRVAAANADVGVARAAYFPVFNLAGLAGLEAARPDNLVTSAASLWALGSSASGPIFDGGQRDAGVDQARAAWREAVGAYRQSVLTAYGEVEDNLTALRQLEAESDSESVALDAARRALAQAQARYRGGLATYLEVISAQNVALAAEISVIDIRTRRMLAAVALIQAIGGGWE